MKREHIEQALAVCADYYKGTCHECQHAVYAVIQLLKEQRQADAEWLGKQPIRVGSYLAKELRNKPVVED